MRIHPRALTRILSGILISMSCFAFISEEKPCGHAHEVDFLQARIPTSEQQKMDIIYYSLNINMDIVTRSMTNEFLVQFMVVDTSLLRVELDYSEANPGVGYVTVDSVRINGDTIPFFHENDMLQIPLPISPVLGEMITVEIFSETGPAIDHDNQGFNWDYENGQRAIWTNSQPYRAREWWPSVDYPRDKADSVDIRVTIDESMTVASNGRLVSRSDNGDGTKTWHWQVGYPIATYLVSLSIYNFYEWGDIYVDTNNDTLPIQFYTYSSPDNPSPSYMTENYRLLPEMITLYVNQFGPYPFMDEKYGHAEWGKNYGMEHQTLTSMGNPTERRVAHELAHMWFGDMITCYSYHHIWLNEGFARYAEALWWEEHYGPAGYREKMAAFEYYGGGTIYVEDPENESIFGLNLSYNKPAWVLHMLRHIVGDETFFEILQTYAADPSTKYKTATTEQFQMVCEAVSGLNLENFFQQWIYGPGFPHYRAYREQNGEDLLVQTIQSGIVFDMPVDIRITTDVSTIDTVLQIHEQFMTFHFEIPSGETVTNLIMDPDDWILKSTDYVVGLAEDGFGKLFSFSLDNNYPNPFNPMTTIPYSLDQDGLVQIVIIDIAGRERVELVNAYLKRGQHQVIWNSLDNRGMPVEAGLYFCRLKSGTRTEMQKLLIVK